MFNWVGNKIKYIDKIKTLTKNFTTAVDGMMGSGNVLIELAKTHTIIGNDVIPLMPNIYNNFASFSISEKVRECYNWQKITGDWKTIMKNSEHLEVVTADKVIEEDSYIEKAIDNVLKWTEDEKELAQTRSNFQIEKFIVLGNYTIPAAVQAVLKERRVSSEAYVELLITMKGKSREFEHRGRSITSR